MYSLYLVNVVVCKEEERKVCRWRPTLMIYFRV